MASMHMSMQMFVHMSVHMSMHISMHMSIHRPTEVCTQSSWRAQLQGQRWAPLPPSVKPWGHLRDASSPALRWPKQLLPSDDELLARLSPSASNHDRSTSAGSMQVCRMACVLVVAAVYELVVHVHSVYGTHVSCACPIHAACMSRLYISYTMSTAAVA